MIFGIAIAVTALLVTFPTVSSFGTTNILGQSGEHERITRAALLVPQARNLRETASNRFPSTNLLEGQVLLERSVPQISHLRVPKHIAMMQISLRAEVTHNLATLLRPH